MFTQECRFIQFVHNTNQRNIKTERDRIIEVFDGIIPMNSRKRNILFLLKC